MDSTNLCRCEKKFTVAKFDTLRRSEFFFSICMKFLSSDQLYVNYIWSKFQVRRFIKNKQFEIYQHVTLKETISICVGVTFFQIYFLG